MPEEHNPIFDRIFQRVESEGDEIIAYIAYGLYKERKKAFLVGRSQELRGGVPPDEIHTFVRTYDDGQISLIWDAAKDSLAAFAVSYSDQEKKDAVRMALADALRGSFWREVWVTTAATLISLVLITVVYFLLRIFGVDLLERFQQLQELFAK